jgi:long-chain acyl-CoA synthetase
MDTASPVVSLSNSHPVESVACGGVAQYLCHQVQVRPRHPVTVFNGVSATYEQLFERAKRISGLLAANGINAGDRVGVLFPNHPDFIASFFGATGLGAVVVPINPLLKSEEIAHILQDSQARALIVLSRSFAEARKALSVLHDLQFVLVITPDGEELNEGVDKDIKAKVERIHARDLALATQSGVVWTQSLQAQNDLCVLVYTSGTTGKPKGAMLTHHNVASCVAMAHTVLEFSSEDRFLSVLPLCHIYGLTLAMLGVISKGGTIVIQERFEAPQTLKLIEEAKVTLIPAVPAMYQFMLMEIERNRYDLSSVRICLCGGSAMPHELIPALEEKFAAPFIEGYGLTEVSCIATANPPLGVRKNGSVGLPMPGVTIGIFDAHRKNLACGPENVGEVAIKGPNVMQGYFNREDATKECLQDGWFFTGDLGYLDEEGYLFIVGRTKELIIRGGQNIYPREIEDVVLRIPQVAEVAVVGVPDQVMGERVKAVIALRKGQTLTSEEAKEFCAAHLAEYKIPRIFEFVAELPRNSTGKVLKRLLVNS